MRRTEVIEQIKDIIRHVAPTAKTILYGSQARNEARSDSDIDLLILLDGEKITLKEEEAITLPLYELELKTGISISPMVMLKNFGKTVRSKHLFILMSLMKESYYERYFRRREPKSIDRLQNATCL